MLLDAIATVILTGLMLIPLVNLIVGGVVGAGLFGPLGCAIGILLAIGIAMLETWLADRMGWRDLRCPPAEAVGDLVETTGRTIRTGPPSPRRQPNRMPMTKPVRPRARAGKMRHEAAG
jgi:hypothetical protein